MAADPQTDPQTAPPQPVLTARGLHRYLGEGDLRNHVLRGVSLEVYPGRNYAIVGKSGSGKSTLLYLLGLLDRQDDGDIFIGGQQVSNASDRERTLARNRRLGFVFQFHFLLPEFTALENVTLPMRKLGKRSEDEMTAAGTDLLTRVGLGGKTHRRANQLSGGEQQRVAVARALANEPELLMADEPTGNLDQGTSDLVFALLTEMARERNQALLMVTHDDALASRCDHQFKMRDGILEA